MCEMKDDNDELPADFDNEIHKWSLECEYIHIWPTKLSADNWTAVDAQWQQWVGLQVLKDYNVQVGLVVYWFVTPCSLIGEYQVAVERTACMSRVEVSSMKPVWYWILSGCEGVPRGVAGR